MHYNQTEKLTQTKYGNYPWSVINFNPEKKDSIAKSSKSFLNRQASNTKSSLVCSIYQDCQ